MFARQNCFFTRLTRFIFTFGGTFGIVIFVAFDGCLGRAGRGGFVGIIVFFLHIHTAFDGPGVGGAGNRQIVVIISVIPSGTRATQ